MSKKYEGTITSDNRITLEALDEDTLAFFRIGGFDMELSDILPSIGGTYSLTYTCEADDDSDWPRYVEQTTELFHSKGVTINISIEEVN